MLGERVELEEIAAQLAVKMRKKIAASEQKEKAAVLLQKDL